MKVNGRFISFGSARFSLTMTLNKIRTEGNARKGTGVDGGNSVVPSCRQKTKMTLTVKPLTALLRA